MSDPLKKCSANDVAACCCVDVGTIIDNEECVAKVEKVVATEADAKALLTDLTQRAQQVQSEACQIESHIEKVNDGYQLSATFTFCCGAESLIFQLGLR
ncbi:MAG: YfcZ/YiiS family protein [Candidatus Schmidhempelia sp.]|nr:YfcZ/YiiS family protein [Candidatus Schmidhempelia sp.]